MLQPLHHNVLARIVKEQETFKSGLFIPETVDTNAKTELSEVIAVGSEVREVAVGNMIVIQRHDGISTNKDATELVIHESQILAIVEGVSIKNEKGN